MKSTLRVPVVGPGLGMILLGIGLSGCTTHYRESLETYRDREPTPFYQRTLEWVESPKDGAGVAPFALSEVSLESLSSTHIAERPDIVAARILGISVETYNARRESLGQTDVRERSLADTLGWDEVMVAVADQNPEVQASRREWEATLRQYSQAEFLEGLLREYKIFTRYLDVGAGEPMQKDMTKSFFPYPSLTTLKGEMIREQVRLAELSWERTLRDTLLEAGSVFFDYLFQHQGAATVEENVKLLEDLIDVVQDRYATGLAKQPDVLKIQGELERQRNLLLDFHARRRTAGARLNALLGRPAANTLGHPVSVDLPFNSMKVSELENVSLAGRQEILEQESRVARMEIAIRMGEVMNRPLFTQGYSTLDRGMMPDAATGEPAEPFGSMPDKREFPAAYAQAEAYLAEMRERLGGNREMLQQVRLDTSALARQMAERADIAHRQMTLVREVVLPLDKSSYDITLRAYTVGESSFLDLLDAERKLIETRLELDASKRDRNQAILEVARVRGHFEGL